MSKRFNSITRFEESMPTRALNGHIACAMRTLIILAAAASVVGCALPASNLPSNFSGPYAMLSDKVVPLSSGKGEVYVVTAIDGTSIDNAEIDSNSASRGLGFQLRLQQATRRVAVNTPMHLTLRASNITAVPIQAIFATIGGSYSSVDGEVEFTALPEHGYQVFGNLVDGHAEVWVQDLTTDRPATKVISK